MLACGTFNRKTDNVIQKQIFSDICRNKQQHVCNAPQIVRTMNYQDVGYWLTAVWSKIVFLPGVRSSGSELGEGRAKPWFGVQVGSSEKGQSPIHWFSRFRERTRPIPGSSGSEFGERNGQNTGLAGSEFGEKTGLTLVR